MKVLKLTEAQLESLKELIPAEILATVSEVTPASPEQLKAARDECDGTDELEIDSNAEISQTDDGYWIQAWVWMPT